MNSEEYPFIIVGSENCDRCNVLYGLLPGATIVKIPNRPLGLGDSIAYITEYMRIPSCRGCKIRRSVLNDWFPYKKRASKTVREIRNIVLKLGHEELPVLLDKRYDKIHDIDDYVPDFTERYFK
jgi:hypothetical protein